MAKKQPFFDFFRFSQKHSILFERNFLQSFDLILQSYMCNGIKIVWLICDKQPKCTQKWPKNSHFLTFSVFSKTVHAIRPKFSTVILHHIRVLYVQWHQNRFAEMRKTAKVNPKMATNGHFLTSFDFLKNFPNDSNEIFYSHSTPY